MPLCERHMASEESQGGHSPLAAGGCVGHGRDAPSLRTLVSAAHERLRMDCVRGSPFALDLYERFGHLVSPVAREDLVMPVGPRAEWPNMTWS